MWWPFQKRANLSRASASIRNAQRDQLIGQLISVPCRDCDVAAGTGCDRDYPGGILVRLNKVPPLLAHASRMVAAMAAHPGIRDLVAAQFELGTMPAELSGDRP